MKTDHLKPRSSADGSIRQESATGLPERATTNIYRLGGLWETYMFKTKPWGTYERYGRAVSRFLEAFRDRKDINSFTRPEIIDAAKALLHGTRPCHGYQNQSGKV